VEQPPCYSAERFPLLRRIARHAGCALLVWIFSAAPSPAGQTQETSAKRVLLISTGSRLGPGFVVVDQQLLQALGAITAPRIETYAENLDIFRFPAKRSQQIFREYLSEKYAEYPPDLILLATVADTGIHATVLQQLFPQTPIVIAGLTEEDFQADQLGPFVMGLVQRTDPRTTLDLMLRLQPEIRRIVVVGGTAEVDRQLLQRVHEAASAFAGRVEFDFWDDRPIADVRAGVAALPPDAAVLFTRMFRDAAGQVFVSSQVGQWIGEWANVPVYVLQDTAIGTGAVGGSVASIEAVARRAGELARRFLTGAPAGSLPFEIRTDTVPMFDWRALQRWRISESRLPPHSVVRYRPASIWAQYRWYILAALLIIIVQSAMIFALAVQHRYRRRIQASLQESQQLMELATKAGRLGLWSRDVATGEVWANTAMRNLLGFDASEVLRFDDLLGRTHPDDRERVRSEVERAQAAGQPFEAEYRVCLPGGVERWLLTRGDTMGDSRGTRRIGVTLDITGAKKSERERNSAQESVREQRAFLRQVIDVNPNFIFAKDREGRFTLANKAVADAYGTTVNEIIGKTDADFNRHGEEIEFFRRMDLEVMNTLQERFIPEERVTDARGDVRWLQTVKRPILSPDGVANQVLGTSTDITQRKKTEIELQQQRAELAHVARVGVLGQLSASLAHELNQPLTAILANAQAGMRLMDREPVDVHELRGSFKDIIEATTRAADIIRGMRAFLRKEEEPEFRTLDIVSLLCDVVRLLHSDAVMQDIRISLDVEAGIRPVRGDRVQLQQVVLNILLNAFDALKPCGANERHISVTVRGRPEDTICVQVSDCGPGLGAEGPDRVFQPFYTTKKEGLGMGLPICRSIVEAHGGSLWAENNADRGATFYFTIPVDKQARVENG
jgi:PAS domain S-box-containing protein